MDFIKKEKIYIYGIINSKEKREEIMNKPNQRLKYDIHFFLTLSHHPNSSYKKTLRERERERERAYKASPQLEISHDLSTPRSWCLVSNQPYYLQRNAIQLLLIPPSSSSLLLCSVPIFSNLYPPSSPPSLSLYSMVYTNRR